jgi:hypothetical protein
MSAMRWPWATGSRCSTAARRWAPAQRGQITPEELQDMMAGGQEWSLALEGSLGGTV